MFLGIYTLVDMAHIFDLAGQIDEPAYASGRKTGERVKFPSTPVFSGFNLPSRIEGDVFDLEFSGQIPPEINGTFYRIQPGELLRAELCYSPQPQRRPAEYGVLASSLPVHGC